MSRRGGYYKSRYWRLSEISGCPLVAQPTLFRKRKEELGQPKMVNSLVISNGR